MSQDMNAAFVALFSSRVHNSVLEEQHGKNSGATVIKLSLGLRMDFYMHVIGAESNAATNANSDACKNVQEPKIICLQ